MSNKDCPNCGNEVEEWFSYCATCGYHLAAGPSARLPVYEHQITVEQYIQQLRNEGFESLAQWVEAKKKEGYFTTKPEDLRTVHENITGDEDDGQT